MSRAVRSRIRRCTKKRNYLAHSYVGSNMKLAYLSFACAAATALAACGSSSSSSSSSIPANVKGGPKGPAPTISWVEEEHNAHFEHTAFPYVSRDGSTVIVAQHDSDGGRGWQNLRFIVKNRKDQQVGEHVVLKADEYERVEGVEGGNPDKTLIPGRIKAANEWLAAQHDKLELVAIPKMGIENLDAGHGEQHTASNPANSTTLKLKDNKVQIGKGTATLVARDMPQDWAAPTRQICKDCDPCSNPHFLAAAALDLDRALAVVTVGYTGTDTCWEPPVQQRVVTW
jgi:hypothetical protein